MLTVDDIIAMKNQKNSPFGNRYTWFFMNIENDLISKSNGPNRVKSFLSDYDYGAKLYVVHQFMRTNDVLASDLFHILELDVEDTFLENKYVDELVDYF